MQHKIENNYRILYFLISIFLIVLSIPAYSKAEQGNSPEKHFLWSVQSGKSTVYLLGSIHVLKKDAYPLPNEIEKAYGCCSKVVFETDLDGMNDPGSQNKMIKRGLYSGGQTLSKNISVQTRELLKKKLTAAAIPIESLEQFKPWFVSLTVTALELQRLGFDPELGIDRYFFTKSKKEEKEIVFLETNEQQLDLIADLSKDQQEMFLRETLKELEVIENMASDMVEAWEKGDTEKLYRIIKIGFEEHPDIYNRFFTQRNRRWVPLIEKLMQEDGDALVIVGAGHLVGEQNLVELLRINGNHVEQR